MRPQVYSKVSGVIGSAKELLDDPSTSIAPPSIHEQREALSEHFGLAMEIHGEALAGRRMRKMGIKYSRFHPQAIEVKSAFIEVHSLRDWTNVLDRFYSSDGPGTWSAQNAVDEVNQQDQSCEVSV